MSAKSHYDNHLGNFYSWMAGDFATKQKEHQEFLEANGIYPQTTRHALALVRDMAYKAYPLSDWVST